MSSSYEFWLCDDSGRRIANLDHYAFASYTRAVVGFGTIQFGLPYEYYKTFVPDIFRPDWRIDVWRSPEDGYPKRRESSYILRKYVIYERVDGVKIIEFYGRSPIDILRRAGICTVTLAQYSKTGAADSVMTEIVNEAITYTNLVVPTGEFSVDASLGIGASVSASFQGENMLDVLNDLRRETISLNNINPTTDFKVYFDVVEYNTLANGGFGYIFRTYVTLRGQDRTGSGLIFSTANGNMRKPTYYEDYLDEVTIIGVLYNDGSADCALGTSPDTTLSRWNRITRLVYSSITSDAPRQAYSELAKNRAQKVFSADFLNTPGGPNQPRSLYGVDWDLGDLVRAEFADKSFDCEIKIVYVSVDENGKENVIGSSEISQ